MLETDWSVTLSTLGWIVGPILLALALAWGTISYRARGRQGSKSHFENAQADPRAPVQPSPGLREDGPRR